MFPSEDTSHQRRETEAFDSRSRTAAQRSHPSDHSTAAAQSVCCPPRKKQTEINLHKIWLERMVEWKENNKQHQPLSIDYDESTLFCTLIVSSQNNANVLEKLSLYNEGDATTLRLRPLREQWKLIKSFLWWSSFGSLHTRRLICVEWGDGEEDKDSFPSSVNCHKLRKTRILFRFPSDAGK